MRYIGALLVALILCAVLAAGCSSSTSSSTTTGPSSVATGSSSGGYGYSPVGAGVDVPKSRIVAVTVSQAGDSSGVATYQGGSDAASLQWIEVSVNNGPRVPIGSATTRAAVRQSVTLNGLTRGHDHVVAVGHFVDGQDQVVLDTFV
jgi:hypothetical protein